MHAIVFLAPLSAFNQTLEEVPEVNRLEDSVLLWADITSSPLLVRAHLVGVQISGGATLLTTC